ncbi:hypothetical protein [Bradyrhizobium sp. dw_78]|uniref:hypothetical protein n=1 Tax=Bradyrhizobium sp. dw_78 TaxID=2719793 RepID=UPI001BD1FEA8|nr:hypothetical protein [Bradyrhizobium sp. dw_78]
MKRYSKLFLAIILGVMATDAAAEPSTCTACDLSHREQIKADRAKYDLENDKVQEDLHREQIRADRAKYDRENGKIIVPSGDAIKDGPVSGRD